jgi:hypothetical protein
MRRTLLSSLLGTLLAAGLAAGGEPKSAGAGLPLNRIILFSSGVGYFQREGTVEGNARVDLQFPCNNINDLLKSLVLQDLGGGHVGTVHYDNRNPIEKTLKSFAIDLTGNPSLAQILLHARGERIEITRAEGHPGEATLTGTIVSLETKKQAVGKDQVLDVEQINLLTPEGLRGVPLAEVQRIRFVKKELERDFRKALEVLAGGHDHQKKIVTLNFTGEGPRPVRVGYVTESPVWKTSYRLALDKNKLFLQGWGIVENTTDEDWKDVHLGLVSGRPISFQMDLYEPLFIPRPVVGLNLFASLQPQTYSGNMGMPVPPQACSTPCAAVRGVLDQDGSISNALGAAQERAVAMQMATGIQNQAANPSQGVNFTQSIASAATAAKLGEYVHYRIDQPVTLPRQKSALLPIVNKEIKGTRVSIYNENVHAKYPLLGLSFKNTTGLHLTQGPVTVFENCAYAGDARIDEVQPGETRLLSYAIDLGTEVEPQAGLTQPQSLTTVKVVRGVLHATFKHQQSRCYLVKNRSNHTRRVWIEYPYRCDWHLVNSPKPIERTREVYRFEVKAEPNKLARLEVVEEQPVVNQFALTGCADETLQLYLRAAQSSPEIKKVLKKLLQLRADQSEVQAALAREQSALNTIVQDQERMRANMGRVPPASQAYKRYLKKFDEQETEIEESRAKVVKLQAAAEKQRKVVEDYVVNLDIN